MKPKYCCFNPCSVGLSPETTFRRWCGRPLCGFNPCSVGLSPETRWVRPVSRFSHRVSILVLLDYPLRLGKRCLDTLGGYVVSILVLLDYPLRPFNELNLSRNLS